MEDFSNIYFENKTIDFSSTERTQSFISIDKLLLSRKRDASYFKVEELNSIQKNFHDLMWYRCRNSAGSLKWLAESEKELPVIVFELTRETEPLWFGVSGMYGGFAYGLFERKGKPVLITDSWVRVVGGSGQQHEITPDKVELVARGFV